MLPTSKEPCWTILLRLPWFDHSQWPASASLSVFSVIYSFLFFDRKDCHTHALSILLLLLLTLSLSLFPFPSPSVTLYLFLSHPFPMSLSLSFSHTDTHRHTHLHKHTGSQLYLLLLNVVLATWVAFHGGRATTAPFSDVCFLFIFCHLPPNPCPLFHVCVYLYLLYRSCGRESGHVCTGGFKPWPLPFGQPSPKPSGDKTVLQRPWI